MLFLLSLLQSIFKEMLLIDNLYSFWQNDFIFFQAQFIIWHWNYSAYFLEINFLLYAFKFV